MMSLRSVYLDPKVDEALAARAEVEGITKAELVRRFIDEGLTRPASAFKAYAGDPKNVCQNCQKSDPYDDHWDDLDGPNRQGYNCQRYRPSIGDEVRAMKEKLRERK